MSVLYETIASLCSDRGISGYRLCKDVGIRPSVLTDLKQGRKKSVTVETAIKIANYFNVDASYLLGADPEQKEKAPALTKKDERDIAKDLEELKASLENNETLMFDGDPMTPEARESILAAMKLGLEAAKVKNKEKYTPKKYKGG